MAHTKSGGSTSLGRDSQSKRLGVKLHAGQPARPGAIIIRQRGTRFTAGRHVRRAGDDTLFATAHGRVSFRRRTKIRFDGQRVKRRQVNVA